MRARATTQEQALLSLARQGKLLRAHEVARHSIPSAVISRLVAKGELERVSRGLYGLPNRRVGEYASIAEASLRIPKGVVCLLSALRIHGFGTQAPFEVWMALPGNYPVPRGERPSVRIVRMSESSLTQGIETVEVDGVSVPVFSASKTVVDCFKYRNKIGIDVALEALRDGWSNGKLSMDDLWRYAAVDRVSNVMRPYLESVAA